jgi:hypothetical protein
VVSQLPALSHQAATWSYRLLWLLAILLVGMMPLIIVARGEVRFGPAAFDYSNRLGHSLIVVDGDVTLRSGVDFPLVVILGDVTVDGVVNSDLVAVGGNVFLSHRADVEGDLVAIIGQVFKAPGATVRGTVGADVRDWTDPSQTTPPLEKVDLLRQVRFGLATGLGLLLLCLVVAAFLPWSIVVTAATARQFPIRSGLAAITGVVVVPLLLLPLILSLVGLPIALAISLGALAVWLIGLAAAGFLVGRRLLGAGSEKRSFFPVLVVGLSPILLVLAVPVLGPLVVGAIGVLGAGARIVSFVERERATDALEAMARTTR